MQDIHRAYCLLGEIDQLLIVSSLSWREIDVQMILLLSVETTAAISPETFSPSAVSKKNMGSILGPVHLLLNKNK